MSGFTQLIALLILGSVSLISCEKSADCGENLVINGYAMVPEGDDLVLTVDGLEKTGIDGFLWECPDMKPYNFLTEGRVHENDAEFVIQDFNIQDVGTYSVKMYPKDDGCEPVILQKTVNMNPKPCDCPYPMNDNTLYYNSSYESQFTEDLMTATVDNSNGEASSSITFSGTNTFTLYFGRKIPEFSSTFRIAGETYIFWDDSFDPYLDVHIHLDGWNHGIEYFYIEHLTEELFVERNGNELVIQFCDLDVHNYVTHQFKLSGRFVVNL